MLAGIAVSLAASALGGLPVWRADRSVGPTPPAAILGSLAIRFLFVVLAALYMVWNQLVETAPFVVWVGLSYLILLPIDVRYLLRAGGKSMDNPE